MTKKEEAFDLHQPKYGKPIKLENSEETVTDPKDPQKTRKRHILGAHSMISQFLNLKLNYKERLQSLTAGDAHAARYLCKDDVAFIFSVDIMRAIVHELDTKYNKKGCVIFFQGLRKSPVEPGHPEKGFAFGRPTLVATAYRQDANGDLHRIDVEYTEYGKETPSKVQAFEHPGDGTGGTQKKGLLSLDDSPVITRVCQKEGDDVCDTDFAIKDPITGDSLLKWH